MPKLLKNISIYAFFNLLNGSIPFLLLPFLTTKLSSESYGIVTMAQVIITMMIPVVILSFDGCFRVNYFKLESEKLPSFIFTGLVVILSVFVTLSITLFFLGEWIGQLINLETLILYIVLLIVVLKSVPLTLLGLFHSEQKASQYGIYMVSITSLNFALSLIFIYYFDLDWKGRIYGILFSELLFAIIGVAYFIRNRLIKLTFSKIAFKKILNYGLPLLPHGISGYMLNVSDRLIIANILGVGAVGIYSVGYQLGSILLIFFIAINQAWSIQLFSFLKEKTDSIRILKLTLLLILLMLFSFVILNLMIPVIYYYVIAEKFHDSRELVLIISIAFLFRGLYFLFTNYIFYFEKTKILSLITFTVISINIILNYLLIPLWGIIGAAYAAAVSNFCLFLATFFTAHKIYPLPWKHMLSFKFSLFKE
ncbi:MAG: O-antigen/teichoic acid export membrane protein [Cyclobacteriaceae bacterium]|jgi:O-antigen/teichoic acid export membrane protein